MKTKPFFYLFIVLTLPLMACGLLQAGIATQTAVAGTAIAASWTATPTPTLTPTQTFTPTPTETEVPTLTPDPCLPENLPAAVKEVDDLQAQFDHLSSLAANVQREQVPDKITEMRSILQAATDQDIPPCLQVLKDHQLKHMNLVIDTLVAFVDGADTKTLNDKIKRASEEYSQYVAELSRLQEAIPTP